MSFLRQKCLILACFIFLYFITFPIWLNAQQINKLDNILSDGEISDSNSFKTNDNTQVKSVSSPTVSKPKTATKISSINSFEPSLSTIKEKQIKINFNGKQRIITIPVFPPKKGKKQVSKTKTKRINESQVLVRIDDNTTPTSYEVPVPYNLFGFPLDPKDETRCEAEKKISEIYNSILEMNSDNYADIVNSVHRIGYAAIEKYSNYPDICAITQLYLNESFIKMYMINDSYKELYSTSREYFKVMQLSTQYSHLNNSAPAIKTLYDVLNSRMSEFKNNEKKLIKSNEYYFEEVKKFYKTLEYYKESVYYGIPTESQKEEYANNIAATYSNLCFSYARIYENYMKMNNKVEADKIFKIENNGKGLKASGLLYEAYSSTPYDQIYKYQYQVSSNGETSTKTAEVKVLMYKDTDKFLRIIENMKYLQTIDKIDKIIGDQSENEKRTLGMCQYLNDYVLDTGSEQKSAAEKISAEKLANYKKYAYSQLQMDSYIDYYKRKPVIKDLYVARTEDTKLSPSTVVRPDEFLVLCAKPDLSNYSKLAAPGYAFLCKIFTVKYPENTEPSLKSNSESKHLELEIDKQKFVTLTPDVLNGGFYTKFQVNESNSTTPPTPEPPPSLPTLALSRVKSNLKINKTNNSTHKILVQSGKDAEKESISLLSGYTGYEDGLILYDKKDFYKKQLTRASWTGLDISKNVVNNTKEFCISGGQEIVFYSSDDKENYLIAQNQADWFIIEGHGEGADGHIEVYDDKNTAIKIFPNELEGKYNEDIDVLILDTCWCLEYFQRQLIKKWQKVLPDGLILGFRDEVDTEYTPLVIQKFSDALEKNMPPKAIGDLYLDVCKIYLNLDDSWFPVGISTYKNVAYLLNGTYGYLKKVKFTSKYGKPVEGYIRKYKNI